MRETLLEVRDLIRNDIWLHVRSILLKMREIHKHYINISNMREIQDNWVKLFETNAIQTSLKFISTFWYNSFNSFLSLRLQVKILKIIGMCFPGRRKRNGTHPFGQYSLPRVCSLFLLPLLTRWHVYNLHKCDLHLFK